MRHRYYHQGPWQEFSRKLDSYERAISDLHYSDAIALLEESHKLDRMFLWKFRDAPTITSDEVNSLLTSVGPPHGYALLEPAPMREMPQFPPRPPMERSGFFLFRPKPKPGELSDQEKREILGRADGLQHRAEILQHEIEADFQKEAERLEVLRNACVANDTKAIKLLMSISHLRHSLPGPLRHSFDLDIDRGARIALCTIEIPDFNSLNIVKKRLFARKVASSLCQREKTTDGNHSLLSLCPLTLPYCAIG